MNMQIDPASFALAGEPECERPQPHLTDIQRLVALRGEIERLQQSYWPMPCEAMDALGDAQSKIEEAIVAAPPTSGKDIAEKFRLAASLIEEGEDGMMSAEPEIVFGAIGDLIAHRCAEWGDNYGEGLNVCPYYIAEISPAAV